MIDKADGTDAVPNPVIGRRMRLLELFKRFKGPVIAIASVGAVLSGLVGYWNVYRTVAVATPTSTAVKTAPASPYSLSVAVMPFIAADPRPTDAALADALTQSLTTNLGQVRTFKVAAPGHSTNEPGKAVDARRVGRESNALYIILGETRQQGDKLGVTLRLVETENATQVWSERFEVAASPTSEQLSHLQGRLARNALVAVYGAAQDRAVKQAELSTPIDFVLRGNAVANGDAKDNARQQRAHYDKALQLDPQFVPAIIGRAAVLLDELRQDADAEKERIAELDALTARAVALDDRDASAWRMREAPLVWLGRWGEAFAANERAMALLPWSRGLVSDRAGLMSWTGRQSEAESLALRAIEMEPPGSAWEFRHLCQARLLMGRYAEALLDCERVSTLDPSPHGQMMLAAAYAQTGDTAKAAIVRAGVLKKLPKLTIANSNWRMDESIGPAFRQQFAEHLLPGLLKAGFPEK